MSSFPPSLSTENLSLTYGTKTAFSGVNLTFQPGQITGIIGPSGCGKSSFLSCLNRLYELIPHTQLQGQIYLNGGNIQSLKPLELRRRVGMLFQKPTPFPLSIIRNLTFPLREHGMRDSATLDEIVETSLQQVGLWDEVKDRLKSPALALSGGQQQRLCLARALALKPEVLLMDEPCSALDPLASEVVEELITQLRGHYTIVVVTHNLAQAQRIADEVGVFWVQDGVGQLIEFGDRDRVFHSPQHPLTQAYISGKRG
jgi:phosphate transport system ATP-binding protein